PTVPAVFVCTTSPPSSLPSHKLPPGGRGATVPWRIMPLAPTAKQELTAGQATPVRRLDVPLCWALQVLPALPRIVPPSPTGMQLSGVEQLTPFRGWVVLLVC